MDKYRKSLRMSNKPTTSDPHRVSDDRQELEMRIFLVGVVALERRPSGSGWLVGSGCQFFDFDQETQEYFVMPISRTKARFLSEYSFRGRGIQKF